MTRTRRCMQDNGVSVNHPREIAKSTITSHQRIQDRKSRITNRLLPGPFETDRLRSNLEFNAKKTGKTAAELRKVRTDANPAGRFGTMEEFGDACAFVCSAQAGFFTGQ